MDATWIILIVAVMISITYRVGVYVGIKRSGRDVRWSLPLGRLFRRDGSTKTEGS